MIELAGGASAGHAVRVRGSGHQATLRPDRDGSVVICADDWTGAALGLGYQAAVDRPGQMDVLRRMARGTLAQLLGAAALPGDQRHRRLGLDAVARQCLELLPADQVALLDAFAGGVNAAPGHHDRPVAAWTPLDCVSVAQVLFEAMSSDGSEIWMTEVLRRSLPAPVVDFLLDGGDDYGTDADGAPRAHPHPPFPLKELRKLLRKPPDRAAGGPVVAEGRPAGSNAWAVSRPGGALLANDMHLQLTDPAMLYPVRFAVGGTHAGGVTVPGLPVLIAGANGKVAWGFTKLHGDNADYHALAPDELAAARTWRETIEVRGEPPADVEVTQSAWGPVTRALSGEQVAFSSTLLDPRALDFGLMHLYEAASLKDAIAIVNDCGMPPVNALLADATGDVAWTVSGRFPRRGGPAAPRGFLTGAARPREWITPEELPRVVQPASGMVINCNNGSPAVREAGLAWNVPVTGRARRVAEQLARGQGDDATMARALQLDLDARFYEYYRGLALRYLPATPQTDTLGGIRDDVEAWAGTAATSERGLPLLTVFRELLREELLAAVTRPARRLDEHFTYCYAGGETPLRRLIEALADGLVPAPWRGARQFVVGQLIIAQHLLRRETELDRLPRWGEVNRLSLSPLAPYPAEAADVALAGCAEAVCVALPDLGAAMRLVADLARPADSTLCIPGGPREGEPMARHIRDWAAGSPQALYPCDLSTEGHAGGK